MLPEKEPLLFKVIMAKLGKQMDYDDVVKSECIYFGTNFYVQSNL